MKPFKSLPTPIRLLAIASVTAALTAGCGGDDGGGGQAASGQENISCSGQKMRFQLSFFPNAQHVGFLVAQNRGFYKAEGLNVEMRPGGPTVNAPLQLAQGNVDIAQVDFPDAVTAAASKAPVSYIAQTYQQDPLRYVSLKSVPLTGPADLRGKTVGETQAGGSRAELRGILAKAGLTEKDITVKTAGFSIEDLLNRKTQVYPVQTYFHIAQLRSAKIDYPGGVNILDPNAQGVAVASQGLAVFKPYMEENRDAVVCFLRATLKGWQTAIDDPKGALADVEKMIPQGASNTADNQVDIEETVKLVTTAADGSRVSELLGMNTGYLESSQEIMLRAEVIKEKADLEDVIDPAPLADARRTAAGS